MSPVPLKAAFYFEEVKLSLEALLPTKVLSEKLKRGASYRALLASVQEVGLVEPLSVYPQPEGKYLILDGHARVEVLRDLGVGEAPCLIATENEGYTYNKQVNRLPSIQANKMILRALEAGVPEERVAKALNLSLSSVREHRRLLRGICPEARELLRDKQVAKDALQLMKRVKPMRQIEMAEMMVASGTYSTPYARALLMTTSKEQVLSKATSPKSSEVSPEDLARLEHEARVQEQEFHRLDETYNERVMALTIARGYLRPLLENSRVVRYLAQNHGEFLAEFQRMVDMSHLAG